MDSPTAARSICPPSMASPLQAILDAELAAGNEVAEVTAWPPKCQLLVILREPFRRSYTMSEGVEFAEINDGHYWKSEYRYNGGMHTLACRS
jgi:hypothetical protein